MHCRLLSIFPWHSLFPSDTLPFRTLGLSRNVKAALDYFSRRYSLLDQSFIHLKYAQERQEFVFLFDSFHLFAHANSTHSSFDLGDKLRHACRVVFSISPFSSSLVCSTLLYFAVSFLYPTCLKYQFFMWTSCLSLIRCYTTRSHGTLLHGLLNSPASQGCRSI